MKSDASLLKTIHEGKPMMPAWKLRLSQKDSRDVLGYIRKLAEQKMMTAEVRELLTQQVCIFMYLLVLPIVMGFPSSSFAQFVDKGEYVEVAKGTKLCANVILEKSKGKLDPEKFFWQVTSKVRANGTQTIAAFVLETMYDRKSGETTIKESRYDEDYATFFKRDPEHKGMLLMVSPQDGRVEAIVELCKKTK
jgi:hypothetical protein